MALIRIIVMVTQSVWQDRSHSHLHSALSTCSTLSITHTPSLCQYPFNLLSRSHALLVTVCQSKAAMKNYIFIMNPILTLITNQCLWKLKMLLSYIHGWNWLLVILFSSGKFRGEFKAAFSCHCYGQDQNQTQRIRTRTSTDSRKSLSTQVNNMDSVSRISDQIV